MPGTLEFPGCPDVRSLKQATTCHLCNRKKHLLSLRAKPMYTDNSSRLLNPYCQKHFLLLSECDKTKEMENDPDRCKSPVSTPPRMEHVVWISQQGCSFPFQTASTGASV